ncbi:TPA: ATP-binding protein [Serratia marcescens]
MAQMRVSARTVDMLGRQQIAGIPTAIHELFKNAHDAYANNVEIDFFESQNLLTLRDDGIGMTKDDFIDKWLTIGTSSKLGVNRKSIYIPAGMEERPLMGEKGIGRLAIASIGRLVLVLSRAERNDGMHDMVVALVHWTQFEIPDISISDIAIPIRTFPLGIIPSQIDIKSMSGEIIENLDNIKNKIPQSIYDKIEHDLNSFQFSPELLFSNLQKSTFKSWDESISERKNNTTSENNNSPLLDGFHRGTHFIIMPCDPALALDIKQDENDTTELQKILVGFANSLNENYKQIMATKFRTHKGSAEVEELIENVFFTTGDARNADHYIEGEFDEYGQFKGSVTVYKGEPINHIINWDENYGSKTKCGKFKIKFSYLQGDASESTVPTQIYTEIKAKLNMFGGLYVYKDGIRVLPYGKPEFDFLRIEERRSKKASTAFFSYRLMFGAIEIEHDVNSMLIEKAGREGLIENIAYREFKSILINFFEQLASDFFRNNSVNDRFWEIKERFNNESIKQKRILDKRRKMIGFKKETFQEELDCFFVNYNKNIFTDILSEITQEVTSELLTSHDNWTVSQKYSFVNEVRRKYQARIFDFNKKIKISKPNVGLNKSILKQWESYLILKEKLQHEIIAPRKNNLDDIINKYMDDNSLSFSRREKVTDIVNEEKRVFNKTINSFKRAMKDNVTLLDDSIKETVRSKTSTLSNSINMVISEINSSSLDMISEDEASRLVNTWEKRLEEVSNETEEYLGKIRESVENIIDDLQSDSISSIDTLIALETENEHVRDSLNKYFDFAQLGMSIGIIQHEFSSTVRTVRQSIKSLKPWADKNPNLNNIFFNINHSFSHLDGYLKMFTPLNRRLYRSKVDLSGKEIYRYLIDIFEERMRRHNISFESTHEFLNKINNVYPSTFLPVFINVIDNAIYWLNKQRTTENPNKQILLDTHGDSLTIYNNGPAIKIEDRDRIFEFTFSRKDLGRGMGLYISKETLNREGFDIKLAGGGNNDDSPCFVIENLKTEISK